MSYLFLLLNLVNFLHVGNLISVDPYAFVSVEKVSSRYARSSSDQLTLEITLPEGTIQFKLKNVPAENAFMQNNVTLSENGVLRNISVDNYYEGNVLGDPDSWVTGFYSNGFFNGQFFYNNENYYVEDARVHNQSNNKNVVYRLSDIKFREKGPSLCGLDADGNEFTEDLGEIFVSRNVYNLMKSNKGSMSRVRRSAERTCPIVLVVDNYMADNYHNDYPAIVRMILSLMQDVNFIFANTRFDVPFQFSFSVRKIEILKKGDDFVTAPHVDSKTYLNAFTAQIYRRDQCLAYAFTHRDFESVLGEAFVGRAYNSGTGICGASHNTGILTSNLYGQTQSQKIISLTLAHELGHSSGSRHDSTPECRPTKNGNYLMFPQVSTGIKDNNNLFSPCSIRQISACMKANDRCFEASSKSVCGNNIVEKGEECDCGSKYTCTDKCCDSEKCKLKVGKKCSPTQGSCCSSECDFYSASHVCLQSECQGTFYCNGTHTVCPIDASQTSKYDAKPCANFSKTCFEGECVRPICNYIKDLVECTCESSSHKEYSPFKLKCLQCCQYEGSPSSCKLASEFKGMENAKEFLQIGSLCGRSNEGTCDAFHNCRETNEMGPLMTFGMFLIGDSFRDAVINYWWLILISGFILLIFMGLFVHFFAIYTPTQNPLLLDKPYKGPVNYLKKKRSVYYERKESRRRGDYIDNSAAKKSMRDRLIQKQKSYKRVPLASA